MKKVLILWPGNFCRSQILEGWFKTFSKGSYLILAQELKLMVLIKDAVFYMNETNIDI